MCEHFVIVHEISRQTPGNGQQSGRFGCKLGFAGIGAAHNYRQLVQGLFFEMVFFEKGV